MGWNDRLDEWGDIEVPAGGVASGPGALIEINDEWLTTADEDDQIKAMKAWFLERYCDPSEETPYNGREGGYLFIHGGPYEPGETLSERFSGFASEEAIETLASELRMQVGDEWAPIHYYHEDEYDEAFDVQLTAADEPMSRLLVRLFEVNGLLGLTGAEPAMKLAQRMAFSAAIAAFESFLYETMIYWIEADENTLKNIVKGLPEFRDEKYKVNLYDIFDKMESLKTDIKGYLQHVVWHNFKRVVPLMRIGLRIATPSFGQFEGAVNKRHDIVHRSGHTKDGDEITVSKEEITELCSQITTFATAINEAINARDGGNEF